MQGALVTLQAGPREKLRLAFAVNGETRDILVDPYKTLLEVLREDLGLTGTKHGCELGECGACAVLLDGDLVLSCLVPAVECEDRAVTTVEGLRDGKPDATREEIAAALAGQLCRCTGYLQIYEAVEDAGRVLRGVPARGPKLPAVHGGDHGRSE
jgi:aerobic-type carbon monoxide dehydrogenase small subunit (CoxS/CutS family)